MRRGLKFIEARVLPRGWLDLIRQLLLAVGAYSVYMIVRGLADGGNLYKPFGDATKIINLERVLHVFIEPSIQAWASNLHWLMDFADWTYLNAHYFVTLGALVFIYLRRNDSFYFVRNMFMIAMAIALVGYALYPTAPPRLMPEWGFTDSISQFIGVPHLDNGPEQRVPQLLRRRPLDARLLRDDDRRPDGPPGQALAGEDRLGVCTRCDHVRGDRDGQPLSDRRVPRRADRGVSALLAQRLLLARGPTCGRSAKRPRSPMAEQTKPVPRTDPPAAAPAAKGRPRRS